MKFADAQFLTFFARLIKDHAEIVSGAYKFQTTQQASGWDDDEKQFEWRDLTDDEKLQQTVVRMGRRIEFMQQVQDHIGDGKAERHFLIYGSIKEPTSCFKEPTGCCSEDGMDDVLAEEPDAKFKPVDPTKCPICERDL